MSAALRGALLLAVLLAALGLAWRAAATHYTNQGRAQVQARWDAAVRQQERDHARATAAAQERERRAEQQAQAAADDNARRIAARETALRGHAAGLERDLERLRHELAAADAAFAGFRASRADASAAAGADAAAAGARELFRQCAGRYAGMAANAAGLAAQVTGLQDHLRIVLPAAAAGPEPAR